MESKHEQKPAMGARHLLVDAHAHVHPCFDVIAFLNAAANNFLQGAAQLGLSADTPGCLLLAGQYGQDPLRRFYDAPDLNGEAQPWQIKPGREDGVLMASRGAAPSIALVAGYQVVTREGLEVLLLACIEGMEDGLPTRDVIAQATKRDALVVLPWGFGKWWLGRGRIVRRTLEAANPKELFLGDNGGRPRLLGQPALLYEASQRGFRILPGSDPLPCISQVDRIGGYGFALAVSCDGAGIAGGLKAALKDLSPAIVPYGRLTPLWRFMGLQTVMQVRKYRQKQRSRTDERG